MVVDISKFAIKGLTYGSFCGRISTRYVSFFDPDVRRGREKADMEYLLLRKKAYSLPLKPGVYQMKDASGKIIYVGKAKKLRNRVSSYFINEGGHGPKTETMVSHVSDFDVIITSTEWEALVLENTLIKLHKPKYNILLKDDKGYPFIRVDPKLPYPEFTVVPRIEEDGARYFGPYAGRRAAFSVLDTIFETFRLPTCSRKFPRDIGKGRPCLDYQLGKCIGVCADASFDEYRSMVDGAVLLLSGKYEDVAARLRTEMEEAAEALEFERAARLRDRLAALKRIGDRQKVVAAKAPDTDIVAFYAGEGRSAAAVLHYFEGTLFSKDVHITAAASREEAPELLEDFLRQFYTEGSFIPAEIVCWPPLEDPALMEKWLSGIAEHPVRLPRPTRERRRFIDMAMLNARDEAERAAARAGRQSKLPGLLQDMLKLSKKPVRIESYDISNTAGGETVGGMVVFVDGKPKKSQYRKFKIKDIEGQNDYAAMQQVLTRRFTRLLEGDEKFSEMPDLLLIDGGEGHVHASREALDALGISCEIRGMVKDDRHRTRAIVDEDGAEVWIKSNQTVFSFIGTVQEEVHRYAIGYHRKLRAKTGAGSELDRIPGIGPQRRNALLAHFKSMDAIRSAAVQELQLVIPEAAAQAVYAYFHEGDAK